MKEFKKIVSKNMMIRKENKKHKRLKMEMKMNMKIKTKMEMREKKNSKFLECQ